MQTEKKRGTGSRVTTRSAGGDEKKRGEYNETTVAEGPGN